MTAACLFLTDAADAALVANRLGAAWVVAPLTDDALFATRREAAAAGLDHALVTADVVVCAFGRPVDGFARVMSRREAEEPSFTVLLGDAGVGEARFVSTAAMVDWIGRHEAAVAGFMTRGLGWAGAPGRFTPAAILGAAIADAALARVKVATQAPHAVETRRGFPLAETLRACLGAVGGRVARRVPARVSGRPREDAGPVPAPDALVREMLAVRARLLEFL
jgi:hypothetical protein